MIFSSSGKSRACATIEPVDKSLLRTGEARFAAPIGGSIWFTSLSRGDAVETKIYTNLFHNRPPAKSSDHLWQLFITGSLRSIYLGAMYISVISEECSAKR